MGKKSKSKEKKASRSKEYSPKTPFAQAIPQPNLQYKYEPLPRDCNEMQRRTTFRPFHKEENVDAGYMSHVFLPNSLIQKWTHHSSQYAMANLLADHYKEVKDYKILHFIAIYYYMVLGCQQKKDYWRQGGVSPAHGVTTGMQRDHFQ